MHPAPISSILRSWGSNLNDKANIPSSNSWSPKLRIRPDYDFHRTVTHAWRSFYIWINGIGARCKNPEELPKILTLFIELIFYKILIYNAIVAKNWKGKERPAKRPPNNEIYVENSVRSLDAVSAKSPMYRRCRIVMFRV
jgi:hypothetical protein